MCRFELSTKHRVARGEEDCLRAVDGRLESFGRLRTGRHLIGHRAAIAASTSLQDLRMPAAVPNSGSATVEQIVGCSSLILSGQERRDEVHFRDNRRCGLNFQICCERARLPLRGFSRLRSRVCLN